ncbi:PP2C family protein-serine/threonine phosphatase [Granulicoccus phenolivorans]|uniref:PP2C family protein-serine/threonine phosphatase n=1 Tax=Granulicoccus phenolivorans TaxID=266854 RepID=UPI0006859D86|nr:PP2C family serine/threonine-protein phosphatase [Granulicoccus phenolivorans]
MTDDLTHRRPTMIRCQSCGEDVAGFEAYCEGCGAELTPIMLAPPEYEEADSPLEPTRAVSTPAPTRPRCRECGGAIDDDGYCEVCGTKAASDRDHYEEAPAPWVAGSCDRGIRHRRNEDALALSAAVVPGSRAVLVVCDGVSTSDDSDVASLAAARAARDLLTERQPQGIADPAGRDRALREALTEAVRVANESVIAVTAAETRNAASCTFAAAVVHEGRVICANVGDSRVYWISDHGSSQLLSRDDSVAQMHIELGLSREEAESSPHAHAITKWLGRDAPDLAPTLRSLEVTESGWLVVCSDGLWNYASEPEDLERVFAESLLRRTPGADPLILADTLVRWACTQGGRDNITVALARFGDPLDLSVLAG